MGGACHCFVCIIFIFMMELLLLICLKQAFTFSGICGSEIDKMEPVDGGCSAVELLLFKTPVDASTVVRNCSLKHTKEDYVF